MAKTNFTKVEEALAEGMRKIEVNRLLDIADETAAANNKKSKSVQKTPPPAKVDAIHLHRLNVINNELKTLEKLGKTPYQNLRIDKEEIKRFVKDPILLTAEDWEKVALIKEQITAYKIELEKKTDEKEKTDDDLVNQQRKSQVTKRFNINKKWIPLR